MAKVGILSQQGGGGLTEFQVLIFFQNYKKAFKRAKMQKNGYIMVIFSQSTGRGGVCWLGQNPKFGQLF